MDADRISPPFLVLLFFFYEVAVPPSDGRLALSARED